MRARSFTHLLMLEAAYIQLTDPILCCQKEFTCNPPTCFVNGTREIQCQSCPFGFGVVVENREPLLCSSSPPRNTKCEPCVAGVNYSDTNDQESKCSRCLECRIDKEVEFKPCTTESNTVCICKEGEYYYNDGLDSCYKCTDCGEDEEETSPCTPTENRECGPRRSPPVTSPSPVPSPSSVPPVSSIGNRTTPTVNTSPKTIDTGESTKPQPGVHSLSGGMIAGIVLSTCIIGVIIIIVVCMRRDREGACSLNCNWHIRETNQTTLPTVYSPNGTNGINGMNGHVPMSASPSTSNHMQVTPNGAAHGHQSEEEEVEHQQSVEDALELSADQLRHVIRALDQPDHADRNVHMLAGQFLSEETNALLSSEVSATEVLEVWVNRGKTKGDLVQALREMGRDDIAAICEEGS
nr:uncharacterized protein LOC129255614 [Lytechinus pictus]